MGNVEIFRRVNGKPIQKAIAQAETVQSHLTMHATGIAMNARARLAAHRDTGHAKVVVESGDIDRYVILDDPNAMQIEFGHGGYEQHRVTDDGREYTIKVGPSRPLYILSRPARLR